MKPTIKMRKHKII